MEGLPGKELQLEYYVNNNCIDAACLTETWLRDHMLPVICHNYHVASQFCRKTYIRGSSIILVNNKHNTKNRLVLVRLSIERVAEISCAELDEVILMTVYSPPDSVLDCVVLIVEDALNILGNKKPIIVSGDFNVDILVDSQDKKKLLNLFTSFYLHYCFYAPTRVTTHSAKCIDNIFTNSDILSKSLIHSFRSDHIGQFITMPALK